MKFRRKVQTLNAEPTTSNQQLHEANTCLLHTTLFLFLSSALEPSGCIKHVVRYLESFVSFLLRIALPTSVSVTGTHCSCSPLDEPRLPSSLLYLELFRQV
ncbi:hypothetical protein SAMN06269173_11457 [Hymenobacter mucosus]|uniref:Uncharacterized protein n=1 Tax=Hymenobacter mucosus TaxID=1411120 RepID=A0A239ASG8_9BACT|nr:hypothetical protein SAMN06269173_11457 [Hymenobacter mucosus]